jgi:hypothetical protein
MKEIITVQDKAAYQKKNLRQQEFTGNLFSRSQQNVSIYFIGLWHYRVSAWCHLTTICWESRKYFLVFASTDIQGL